MVKFLLVQMTPMEMTARGLSDRLRAAGHIAYFAGGCVRDLVRGQVPKDIDIATDARPEEVQKIFQRTYAVGAHFGVIVVLENGFQVEVATFRSDGAYLDRRHPVAVHFSSPEEDARRRDFTINGMFLDTPNDTVIDFVDGRQRPRRPSRTGNWQPGATFRGRPATASARGPLRHRPRL